MKYLKPLLVVLSTVMLISCNSIQEKYNGYTYHEQGFYFKLLGFSEGNRTAKINDYVIVDIQFSPLENDSIKYTETFVVHIQKLDSLSLSSLFNDMRMGDSISYIIPKTKAILDLLPTEYKNIFNEYTEISLTAKINKIVDAHSYNQKMKEYNEWSTSKRKFEYSFLSKYLTKSTHSFKQIDSALYISTIKPGNGVSPQKDDVIQLSYTGMLLNGDIIQSVSAHEFKYGEDWQLLLGLEKALAHMTYGEKAVIVMASDYAWGEKGSSDGSIQAFSSVQFEIELQKSKK